MKKSKLLFLLELEKLKTVKRYASQHPNFHESVNDHIAALVNMASEVMKTYKIDLDYKKVIDLIRYHDLGELNMSHDIEAGNSRQLEFDFGGDYQIPSKDRYEMQTIDNLSENYNDNIKEVYLEYRDQKSQEAKFVKTLDKLEATVHKMSCDVRDFDDPKFSATCPNRYVKSFSQLAPFWQELQQYMKKQYTENNISWKDSYDFEISK